MTQEEKYMKEAIKQAKKAAVIGDVPIGCVIVEDDKIIARAYNQRNKKKTTLAHAELLAIQKASKKVNDWRLEDCTMYITLEPCQMWWSLPHTPADFIGTMPDVRRSYRTGTNSQSCDRSDESKGGLCRICIEYFTD